MARMNSLFFLFAVSLVGISTIGLTSFAFAESDAVITTPELKKQINERYMAVELSHYLIDNKVNWKLYDGELSAPLDVGRNAPWTLCTKLLHPDEQIFFLSITNLDGNNLSDVSYHKSMPDNCAFFVNPPQIITNPDNFIVKGDKPDEWLRDCWKFDYTQDFFTVDNPYHYTSSQHRDYVMCKTAIDLNLYEADLKKLGKHLDWNNYAEQTTSEYLKNWNFGDRNAFSETLKYQTFVSNRDSLPPKMHATVTFDYSENGNLQTFDGRFTINPLYSPALFLEWENNPVPKKHADILCDSGSALEDGKCHPVSEKISRDDAPFFGIFVYLDDLISWISGTTWNDRVDEKIHLIDDDKIITDKYKDLPEVVAFYAKYNDTLVSVRDDHMSYVSGSDDGLKIRMNLFFNENYDIIDKSLTCYYKKAFQFESSPEDVLYRLQSKECKQSTNNFDLSKIGEN